MDKLNDLETLAFQLQLIQRMPFIEACCVGGSVGDATADQLSDVDLFLLVSSEDFFQHLSDFGVAYCAQTELIAWRYRGFLIDFGFHYTFVHPGPAFVDVFLNCVETLVSSPMQRRNRMVFDKTGRYTATLTGLLQQAHLSPDNVPLGEFLIELDNVAKNASRRSALPMLARLDRLRSIAIALRRMEAGYAYNSYGADRDVPQVLGGEYERWLLTETLPSNSLHPWDVFESVYIDIVDVLRRLGFLQRAHPGYMGCVLALREEIRESLRTWNPLSAGERLGD